MQCVCYLPLYHQEKFSSLTGNWSLSRETKPYECFQIIHFKEECVSSIQQMLTVNPKMCSNLENVFNPHVCVDQSDTEMCFFHCVGWASRNVCVAESAWRAILVICRGPRGILDVPCENMHLIQEYPRVYVCTGCFTVFVIPADGNRQSLQFHRHRKGFVLQPGDSALSLQAWVPGRPPTRCSRSCTVISPAVLSVQWYRMYSAGFNERLQQKTKIERKREMKKLDRKKTPWKSKFDMRAMNPDPRFNVWC